jgi:hypothetical protein
MIEDRGGIERLRVFAMKTHDELTLQKSPFHPDVYNVAWSGCVLWVRLQLVEFDS